MALYRWLLRLVGDDALAEDLLSEAFLAVWRQAHRFEGRSSVSTWLLAIARNKALSTRRSRTDAELDEESISIVPDTADDPEVALLKKNRAELLLQSIARLSPEHREVIDLVYYHGKAVTEVAEIVGINAATAKTRMFYARKRLAEGCIAGPADLLPNLPSFIRRVCSGYAAETILWIAGGWSFPAYSRRRAGCAVTIEQRNRGLLPYRPMGTFFVVVPTPILHLFLGIRKA